MTPYDSMVGLQSIVTLTAGTLLLLLACRLPAGQRGRVAAVLLLGVLVAALALPFAGERYGRRMGDLATYTRTREAFINYSARSAVRFEAHLSHLVVAGLDMWLGETEESPDRAFQRMSQIGAALFFASLAAVAVWKAPAPRALRYAGLCLLVPTTLLMFGFRELGKESLSLAPLAVPLLLEGLRQRRTPLVAAGAAAAGLCAAFHGFGLLLLLGGALAALVAGGPWRERIALGLTIFAFGTSLYLVWIFIDVTLLGLPISTGHAYGVPLRPLLTNRLVADVGRIDYAALSSVGLRDIALTACITGATVLPLVAVHARRNLEARLALFLALPSLAWLIAFWPIQGIGVELDLVSASFPAIYGLLWVCAEGGGAAAIAATTLAGGHVAFWFVMLMEQFINKRVS